MISKSSLGRSDHCAMLIILFFRFVLSYSLLLRHFIVTDPDGRKRQIIVQILMFSLMGAVCDKIKKKTFWNTSQNLKGRIIFTFLLKQFTLFYIYIYIYKIRWQSPIYLANTRMRERHLHNIIHLNTDPNRFSSIYNSWDRDRT